MFVVHTGVKHSDDHALAVVSTTVGTRRIDIGRHSTGGFARHAVEGDHDILHFNDDHALKSIDVHEGANGNFVHYHGVDRFHDLKPCAAVFLYPSVMFENTSQFIHFIVVRGPSIVNDDSNGFSSIGAENRGR